MEEATYRRGYQLEKANAERIGSRYRSLVWHWMSRWFRRPGRAAAAPLPSVRRGQVGISFAGHASLVVRYANLAIACDPMLGRWCKGIHREVAPGLSPAELGDVDLILISHDHMDHLHPPTLAKLPRAATVIVPPRTAHHVADLGFARVVELGVGQSVQIRRVDIATTVLHHGTTRHPASGYVIRGEGPSVFFCGDSGYFSGFAEIGRRYRPDIALLPIGGYLPVSFRERHMSPLDALYAFEDLQSRIMIPHHYGAFALSYEHLCDPGQWLRRLVAENDLEIYVQTLEPGESRVFSAPDGARRAGAPEPAATDITMDDEDEPTEIDATIPGGTTERQSDGATERRSDGAIS